MKKKTVLKITLILVFLLSITSSVEASSRVDVDINISNYGYGMGVHSPLREGFSFYINKNIRSSHSYTRAGMKLGRRIDRRLVYWSLGYVNHQGENFRRHRMDTGMGIKFDLPGQSYINFEAGYSTAVPNNIYYGLNIKLISY